MIVFASPFFQRYATIFCLQFVFDIMSFSCVSKHKQLLKKTIFFSACLETTEVHRLLSDWPLLPRRSLTPSSLLFFLISLNICWFLAGFDDQVPEESTVSRSDCTRDHIGKVVQQHCTK